MPDFSASLERYLSPTEIIDSDHPEVIRFAAEITAGAGDPIERVVRLFYAVRDRIVYDVRYPFFLPEHYRASAVLASGRGFCIPKASLLCAAGRASKVPARLAFADIRNRGASPEVIEMMGCDIFTYHGFVEFHLNGRWIKATPAFDAPIYEKHRIPPVTFDGKHDAVFPSHDLDGNPYVEYVGYHGTYADVPLPAIIEAWREQYGDRRVDAWMEAFGADIDK